MNVKARLHRRQSRRQSDYLTAFVAGRRAAAFVAGRRAAALLLGAVLRRCSGAPAAVHRYLLPTHAHGAQQQTRRCCGQITGQADGLLDVGVGVEFNAPLDTV